MKHRGIKESTFPAFVRQDNKSWMIIIPIVIARRLGLKKGSTLAWYNSDFLSQVYSPNGLSLSVIIPSPFVKQHNLGYGSYIIVNIRDKKISIKNMNWFDEDKKNKEEEDKNERI